MGQPLVIRGRQRRGADPMDFAIEDGVIRAITPLASGADHLALGGPDCLVAEGFFDIQVNGFAGVDFNRPTLTPSEFRHAAEALWRTGVTQFLPTVITASEPDMLGTLAAIAAARESDPTVRQSVPALHLEGPFLAPEDGPRGSHPAAHIQDPDWGLIERLQDAARGLIRLVTLAPERPGAIGLIWQLRQAGIVAAIGHTAATAADIDAAVQAGAQLSGHLGNGAHAKLPRHQNYVQKQLATDELVASLIVDGHHLPSYVVKNMVRCKGADRVILTTDAMAAAGAPPGRYRIGEVLAEVGSDGYVRLPGTPYLAGSALTMDRAVRNLVEFSGMPLDDALHCAARHPRRLFPGLGDGVAVGQPANLTLLRLGPPLTVEATILGGEVVYQRRGVPRT